MRLACALVVLGGCQSALDQRLDIIDQPRVLAMVSEPPEVVPGNPVAVSAIIGGPDGPLAVMPAWSLCDAPKPPTVANAVANGCVADEVTPIPDPSMAVIPIDACETYGPDVESTGFAPRSADGTGGYYQPIRAQPPAIDLAFGFARITCDLPSAPGAIAREYQMDYVANANPILEPVTLAIGGAAAAPDAIAAGAEVALTASWPVTETYLDYDPTSEALITRRESMAVSWFATAGDFPVDATDIGETDLAQRAQVTWTAPSTPGAAWLWIVLRDSRGGVAAQSIAIAVQ